MPAKEGHTLWHRPSRRYKWRAIGTRATRRELLDLMDWCGFKAGEWMLRDANDPPERAKETDR